MTLGEAKQKLAKEIRLFNLEIALSAQSGCLGIVAADLYAEYMDLRRELDALKPKKSRSSP